MAIQVKKRYKIIFSVPILKRSGWDKLITYQVTSSPGLTVSLSAPSTTGPTSTVLNVSVDVSEYAALGENFVTITGSPAPKSVKTILFDVTSNSEYGWEYGVPSEDYGWELGVPVKENA